ncbi:MAG: hypothetical protein ACI4NV_05805 [Thermoguttaceae bacterium]
MQELYVKSISKADLAARNWLDWRDEFQRTIDESSFTKPTPRRMSYFFTLLLAEIESALKEKFAQTKAHLIFAPSRRKIIKTGYNLLITDLDASPSDVKENIDEAQSFFNSVKVQETKFLFSEWVEAAVLKEYETKARTWSRRLVASRNDAYYKPLFDKSPHDARNYLLASLAGYWRWGELHLKELKENPDLSRLLDYAVERIRRVADDLGFDDCERFLEEYPNLTDWELRDFQRLAKDVVPEVDYFVKDHLYKTFALKVGVPYDGPRSPLDPSQRIPRDVLFLYRLKRWENRRRGIRKIIEAAQSSFEPSEFNVDQVCYYVSCALRNALAKTLRQEIPECPDEIVDAEIAALIQSGYASMKSAEFANALANQRPFELKKETLLFCERADVKDAFNASVKETLVEVARTSGESLAILLEVEIDDLATFEENVAQKSRENRNQADQYALLHILLYRAWIDSHVEEILESDKILAAIQKAYASFDELADRYSLTLCQERLNEFSIFRKKKVFASLESLNKILKGRAQSAASAPSLEDSFAIKEAFARGIVNALGENVKAAILK